MNKEIHKKYMLLAIKEAGKNIKSMEGGPFGACIIKNNRILAIARNTVLKSDATAHAEINAIRLASRKLNKFDLSGCIIYSTTEPCPMCFSAIHWAGIKTIFYGTTIADAKRIGFNELRISCKMMKELGKSKIRFFPGILRAQCFKLMKAWSEQNNKTLY